MLRATNSHYRNSTVLYVLLSVPVVGFVLYEDQTKTQRPCQHIFRNKTMSQGRSAASPTFKLNLRMGRSVSRIWPETPKLPEVGKIVEKHGCNVSSQFRGVPGSSGANGFSMFISYQELSSGDELWPNNVSLKKECQRIRSLCRDRELRPTLPIFKEKSVFVQSSTVASPLPCRIKKISGTHHHGSGHEPKN